MQSYWPVTPEALSFTAPPAPTPLKIAGIRSDAPRPGSEPAARNARDVPSIAEASCAAMIVASRPAHLSSSSPETTSQTSPTPTPFWPIAAAITAFQHPLAFGAT
jgi:hypothetical protein